jgi:hypothetical protein
VQRGIVAPLSYAIPRRPLTERAVAQKLPMLSKQNRHFPYLFKNASYRFEEEIRFVFGTSPDSIYSGHGVFFGLDPTSFVEAVWTAPGTVEPERRVITKFWDEIKDSRRFLNYPSTNDERHVGRYPLEDQPFSTPRDDLDGLFKDLPPVGVTTKRK